MNTPRQFTRGDQIANAPLWHVEYEMPPLRAIYWITIQCASEEVASETFAKQCPHGTIRSVRLAGSYMSSEKDSL